MADEPTVPAGEQQAEPDTTQTSGTVQEQPETGQSDDYKGAGSKDALKADLAAERDKRQALEADFRAFKDGLAKLFGGEPEQVTPEQLQQQVTDARSEATSARIQLAVYQSAPAGVDANALLDSQSFLAAIANLDTSDTAAIEAAVTEFVNANPRFRTANPAAGARDAAASGPTAGGFDMDRLIRGR